MSQAAWQWLYKVCHIYESSKQSYRQMKESRFRDGSCQTKGCTEFESPAVWLQKWKSQSLGAIASLPPPRQHPNTGRPRDQNSPRGEHLSPWKLMGGGFRDQMLSCYGAGGGDIIVKILSPLKVTTFWGQWNENKPPYFCGSALGLRREGSSPFKAPEEYIFPSLGDVSPSQSKMWNRRKKPMYQEQTVSREDELLQV